MAKLSFDFSEIIAFASLESGGNFLPLLDALILALVSSDNILPLRLSLICFLCSSDNDLPLRALLMMFPLV